MTPSKPTPLTEAELKAIMQSIYAEKPGHMPDLPCLRTRSPQLEDIWRRRNRAEVKIQE